MLGEYKRHIMVDTSAILYGHFTGRFSSQILANLMKNNLWRSFFSEKGVSYLRERAVYHFFFSISVFFYGHWRLTGKSFLKDFFNCFVYYWFGMNILQDCTGSRGDVRGKLLATISSRNDNVTVVVPLSSRSWNEHFLITTWSSTAHNWFKELLKNANSHNPADSDSIQTKKINQVNDSIVNVLLRRRYDRRRESPLI